MQVTLLQYLIVCPLIFLAGVIDAMAGGGGVVSISALLLAGLPVHTALGTNKVIMSCGTFIAAGRYLRAGQADLRASLCAAAGALLGAALGTRLALAIPERTLSVVMLVALPAVGAYLVFKKDLGAEQSAPSAGRTALKTALLSACIGLACGCYDGLIGPGTGTFMTIGFAAILGFDLLRASGCARVANLASGIGSAFVFLLGGKVLWALALPAALCAMLGGAVGSGMALRGGSKAIRAAIFVVLGLMLVKMIYELWV